MLAIIKGRFAKFDRQIYELNLNLNFASLNQFSMSESKSLFGITQSVFNLRSTINMFLYHIGVIRDDICNSYKKIQPGTNLTSKCFTFGGK